MGCYGIEDIMGKRKDAGRNGTCGCIRRLSRLYGCLVHFMQNAVDILIGDAFGGSILAVAD